jgi:hypothetical protein
MDEKMPPQQHRPDFEVVKARGRAECRPEEGSEEGEALLTRMQRFGVRDVLP